MELSESLDLIKKIDICESETDSKIPIDGTHILARVKGPMFFPDAPSRNQRYYPRQLWENVCSNPSVRERMKNRNLYSTISHDIPYSDVTLAEGKYSHFITDMYIDENNQGICEFYILGTPSGRILNTHLRAGCRMYSSTRADGAFSNETYQGMPIVDPSTYTFFGMDIVTEPGFLQANPGLMESLKEDYKKIGLDINLVNNKDYMINSTHSLDETVSSNESLNEINRVNSSSPIILNTKDYIMANETQLLESLTKEATDARAKMNEALNEAAQLQSRITILEAENKQMTEEFKSYKADVKRLAIYETLGTPSEIESVFDQVSDLKDKLDAVTSAKEKMEAELGSIEDLRSALDSAEEMVRQKSAFEKEFGDEDTIRAAFDSAQETLARVSAFEASVGSLSDVEKALSSAEELCSACSQMEKEVGSAAEIAEAFRKSEKLLETYRSLGTPSQIRQAFQTTENYMRRIAENKRKHQAVRIANDIGATPKAVYEMLRKGLSESFIRQNLTDSSRVRKGSPTSIVRESMTRPKSVGDRLANFFFHTN